MHAQHHRRGHGHIRHRNMPRAHRHDRLHAAQPSQRRNLPAHRVQKRHATAGTATAAHDLRTARRAKRARHQFGPAQIRLLRADPIGAARQRLHLQRRPAPPHHGSGQGRTQTGTHLRVPARHRQSRAQLRMGLRQMDRHLRAHRRPARPAPPQPTQRHADRHRRGSRHDHRRPGKLHRYRLGTTPDARRRTGRRRTTLRHALRAGR